MAFMAVARAGEVRKLVTSSSYSSFGAAGCCFGWKLSPPEDGAGREETLPLLLCAWISTDKVLAGCTGGTDGVFAGAGKGRSDVPGSFFIFS